MPGAQLLMTKITIPPLRARLLLRERLIALLNQASAVPLILVSASAGSGKSTLLSAWAHQSSSVVAWLTIDEQDDDPTRFWTYVVAALQHSGLPIGEAALAMLQSPQPPPLTSALTALINDLSALSPDTALILDDYHLISEPAIHNSLQFVLEHCPPCLHLFLASRGDPPLPLARLRARGQVVEVRATDLRLNGDEAARFLTEVMGLALTDEQIDRLATRTEGWIAGLQLAALSLRRHDDASVFIQSFAGSHRLILDYIQEEIIDPLPEAQQRFLLQTSVLGRLNADLCQALTEEPASQVFLEDMERSGLFLVPLDDERRWYRFHALFREVLLARLRATQPTEVARLHRIAALWYQRQGWPQEAIPHGLASQDFALVADLLESQTERLFLHGELKTLLTWVELLPQNVLRAHPRLATSYILAFQILFPFTEQQENHFIRQLRADVERIVQSEDETELSLAERNQLRQRLKILGGWRLVARALSEGDVEQLTRVAEQAQELSLDDDSMWQQHRLGPLAMAWRMAGNFPPMLSALQANRLTTQNLYLESQFLWGLVTALIACGQLREAHDRCRELQQIVDRLGRPLPVAAYPDLFQAQLAYAWNQLDVAKSAARKAIEQTTPLQYMDILMVAYEVLVRVCLAQNDLVGAERAVQDMERVYRSAEIPLFRPWVESLQVQIWLARGDLVPAADWADNSLYRREEPVYPREGAYLTLARVDLALGRYPQALSRLAGLLRAAVQVARVGSVLSILALQVAALQASGASPDALRVLPRLLALTEPEGCVRVFLDAGQPMRRAIQILLANAPTALSPSLAAFAQTVSDSFAREQPAAATETPTTLIAPSPSRPPSSAESPLIEPLTPREQEVLRLLATGATNQEIADRLVVSLTTVKKHVGSLLLKLAAENRTHAVARARELALL